MSEKKRKGEGHDNDDRPEKRAATEHMQLNGVKVSLIPEANEWALFIAKTPGVSFPSNCPLKPYIKTGKNNASKNNASSIGQTLSSNSEHLLHTSAHPKIDYIGREEDGVGLDSWLNHYIGVYDPDTGQLQLVRARKLVLRSSVRHAQNPAEEAVKGTNGLSGRNTLGLTFGTKKSQRAIQALAKNAISPSKQRLAQGSPTTPTLDPTASAILSSVAATTSSMPTREELQTLVDESKPRPRPTLNAGNPAEVYPIEELVGQGTLPQMMVKDWQDAIEAGEEILTKSRFVSHRVGAIVKSGDVRKLKTLKYLLLLVEWYNALQPVRRGGGRRLLQPDKLQQEFSGWSSSLVDSVSQRFTEGSGGGRNVTRWHLDNLITHICATAITVDGFTSNVYDLGQDLRLEAKNTRSYFREIGCQVGPPTEAEMKRMGLRKKDVVARLKLPLSFPKMRVPVGRGRG